MKAHPAITAEHEAYRDTVRRVLPSILSGDDALDWARQRQTFGKPLIGRQAIRHKPVDMQARVHAARIYREAKVMQIGGGSTEIMKDLAARQLGWEP